MELTNRFYEALNFTCRLHDGHLRKGTQIPYLSHLLAVAGLVMENGGNEDEVIAALLHDGPEDRGGRPVLDEIRHRFGDNVAGIVEGCSDTLKKKKPEWKARKQKYLAHLPKASASARLISACDKLHNSRCILRDYRLIGEAIWGRFSGGKKGTLWYYRALVGAYRRVESTPLIDELDTVVTELERAANA
jgi:(p)ppGpp synthase/HD superfamily hydrolase